MAGREQVVVPVEYSTAGDTGRGLLESPSEINTNTIDNARGLSTSPP